MAILGLAMILAAVKIYPRTSDPAAPAFSTLQVTTHFPIFGVSYLVIPRSPGIAELKVIVSLPDGTTHPPAHAPAAGLEVELPSGMTFWPCPRLTCPGGKSLRNRAFWSGALTFNSVSHSAGEAITVFFVKAPNFGVTSNGVEAAAAIPAVFWFGPGQPLLYAGYGVHSATSYDWSPAVRDAGRAAIWTEALGKGYTPGLTATGIDHSAQSSEDFMLFLAGALIALGGGSILAAIIEAVHRHDWDTIRELRSK